MQAWQIVDPLDDAVQRKDWEAASLMALQLAEACSYDDAGAVAIALASAQVYATLALKPKTTVIHNHMEPR